MNHGRSFRSHRSAGVLLLVGLLALAGFALAQQATIHRNGFETKIG